MKFTFIRTYTTSETVLVEADSIEQVKDGDYEEIDIINCGGDDYEDDITTIELYEDDDEEWED